MNLSLLGPSGAGKGTHALALRRRFNLVHAASGDLFRENLASGTALGLLARGYIARGELVPDEVVDAMMEEWLRREESAAGVLFDGFPRTAYQARFLDALLKDLGRELNLAVYVRVSDGRIMERLGGRRICGQCQASYHERFHPPARPGTCDRCGGELHRRPDDVPELIQARLRSFHRVTGPVLEYYQQSRRLVVLDGESDVVEVRRALTTTLEHLERGEMPAALLATAADIAALRPVTPAEVAAARPSLDIVLLGGPGSGKGTQAEQLCQSLGLPHIATGDLFRENLKNQTDLGKLAKTYMDRGELVPDDVTEAMVEQRLAAADTGKGFVLDGFPRTLPQAEALTDMLGRLRRRLEGVIFIEVSDDEIVDRLGGRLICRQCQSPFHRRFKPPKQAGVCDTCGGQLYQRDDDNPTTVKARLKAFHAQTAPLVDYYRRQKLLYEVNGEGALADVTARTLAVARKLAGP